MSCSAYFACLVQEFVCGKTGSENSLLKSKAWKWQLSLAHTLQMCTELRLHLVALPSEAMTWIEQKGYVWLPLFREK